MKKGVKAIVPGELKIESGVPMPNRGKTKWAVMEKMSSGDSFFLPVNEGDKVSAVRMGAYLAARRRGIKVVTASVPGGIRVWRA